MFPSAWFTQYVIQTSLVVRLVADGNATLSAPKARQVEWLLAIECIFCRDGSAACCAFGGNFLQTCWAA